MYYLMTILLAMMGLVFTVLALISDRESPVFAALGLVVWMVAAGTVSVMEIPYTAYNASDNTIVSGTYAMEAGAPLSALFLGLGFFCLVWLFIAVFRYITEEET